MRTPRAFLQIQLFQDGCRRDFPEVKKSFFFRQTVMRLGRIQIYYSGALSFAATRMKHCRAIFN